MPAQAGIQNGGCSLKTMDSRLRGNDEGEPQPLLTSSL